jgi:hypothetical protein
MAQITLDLQDQDLADIKKAAGEGGIGKYFQDALGLAKLVQEERKKNNIIAIADKDGKVLRTVKPAK